MTDTKLDTKAHPKDSELADFLGGSLSGQDKDRIESHIASCDECLEAIVSAHDSVAGFKQTDGFVRRTIDFMKKINLYLIFAVISFALSFVMREYFLQFLVATLVLGAKWIIDSRTTKMLIMIHEAWKKGGEKEASRILEKINTTSKSRF